jgi:hypothetical protein
LNLRDDAFYLSVNLLNLGLQLDCPFALLHWSLVPTARAHFIKVEGKNREILARVARGPFGRAEGTPLIRIPALTSLCANRFCNETVDQAPGIQPA